MATAFAEKPRVDSCLTEYMDTITPKEMNYVNFAGVVAQKDGVLGVEPDVPEDHLSVHRQSFQRNITSWTMYTATRIGGTLSQDTPIKVDLTLDGSDAAEFMGFTLEYTLPAITVRPLRDGEFVRIPTDASMQEQTRTMREIAEGALHDAERVYGASAAASASASAAAAASAPSPVITSESLDSVMDTVNSFTQDAVRATAVDRARAEDVPVEAAERAASVAASRHHRRRRVVRREEEPEEAAGSSSGVPVGDLFDGVDDQSVRMAATVEATSGSTSLTPAQGLQFMILSGQVPKEVLEPHAYYVPGCGHIFTKSITLYTSVSGREFTHWTLDNPQANRIIMSLTMSKAQNDAINEEDNTPPAHIHDPYQRRKFLIDAARRGVKAYVPVVTCPFNQHFSTNFKTAVAEQSPLSAEIRVNGINRILRRSDEHHAVVLRATGEPVSTSDVRMRVISKHVFLPMHEVKHTAKKAAVKREVAQALEESQGGAVAPSVHSQARNAGWLRVLPTISEVRKVALSRRSLVDDGENWVHVKLDPAMLHLSLSWWLENRTRSDNHDFWDFSDPLGRCPWTEYKILMRSDDAGSGGIKEMQAAIPAVISRKFDPIISAGEHASDLIVGRHMFTPHSNVRGYSRPFDTPTISGMLYGKTRGTPILALKLTDAALAVIDRLTVHVVAESVQTIKLIGGVSMVKRSTL
jgi:hypothetical protein